MTKPIGQINIFAVPRSGGTILNLFLREFVCEKCSLVHPQMLNDKSKSANDYGNNNLFLFRHPFGIYGSMLHVDSIDRKDRAIKVIPGNAEMKLNELDKRLSFFYDFVDNNKGNGIVINYEDYHNNYDYLRTFISDNYNVQITDEQFNNFQADFCAETIAQDMIAGQKKRKDFRPFHVSSGKGDNKANLKLIPEDYRETATTTLQKYIDRHNYETFDLSTLPNDKVFNLDEEYH